MTEVPVTLIIPTRNGGPLFRRVLAALGELEPRPAALLVVDSESTDGSDEAAAAAGADVVRIRRVDFDHGGTRQWAAERSATELVAFLSQDALPERDYLGALARAFDDPRVAGASARVLPLPESSPLASRTVLASPMASAEPQVFDAGADGLAALPLEERRRRCRYDNVASMARRRVLLELPFPRTMMGEDTAFAEQVLEAGHRIAFVPAAVVRHAHEYGPASAFRRYRDDARWVRARFGVRVRGSCLAVLRGLAYEVREDLRFLSARRRAGARVAAGEWLRSPLLRGGQVVGQWWGSITRVAS